MMLRAPRCAIITHSIPHKKKMSIDTIHTLIVNRMFNVYAEFQYDLNSVRVAIRGKGEKRVTVRVRCDKFHQFELKAYYYEHAQQRGR